MALPRYNQASISPQVGSSGQQAIAQEMSGFAQRLQSWNDAAYGALKEQAIESGRDKAVNDLVSGDPARLEKGYSFYAKAYNEVSKAAFNVSTESDIKNASEQIAMESQGDPDKFNAMFQAYSKTVIGNIQEPEFKAIAMQTAQKVQGTKYNSLVKDRFENSRKLELDAIDAGIADETTIFESAFASGDFDTTAESMAKINALLESKVKSGHISERMVPIEINKIVKRGVETKLLTDLDNELESGNTHYIQDFMKSEQYKAMPVSDRQAITKRMFELTDNKYKAVTESFDGDAKLIESASKSNTARYSKDIMLGNPPTEQQLKDALADGDITPNHYRDIMQLKTEFNNGAMFSDEGAVLDYELNIESVSPISIARDQRLSVKDKQRLVSKAINHKETVRANTALADALKGYSQTMGGSPYKIAGDFVKANIVNDDNPTLAKKKQNEIINKARDAVKSGQIDVLQVPDYVEELTNKHLSKTKDISISSKYDREYKAYQEKLKVYQSQKTSTFGKIKDMVGVEIEAPKAPQKPSNYIPKNQRVY